MSCGNRNDYCSKSLTGACRGNGRRSVSLSRKFDLLRHNQPVEAKLSAQVENRNFGGEPGLALRTVLNNWVFLGTVICLMVVVLGWILFRAGRHLEGLPKD